MNKRPMDTGSIWKRKRGGFPELVTIAYRNIYRNMRRSVLCILAIGTTVFFIIAMAAMMEGFLDTIEKQVITYETGHVLVTSAEYEKKSMYMPLQYPVEIPGEDLGVLIKDLESIPGIAKVFPRIKTRATVMNSVTKSAILLGTDMKEELKYNIFNYKTKNANDCLVEGRYPEEGAREAAIGYRLAKKMGKKIGDEIELQVMSSEFSPKYYFPVITGIVDFNFSEMDKNVVIIPFSRAQKLAALEGKTQSLYIYAKSIDDVSAVTKAVEEKLAGYGNLSIKPYTSNALLVLMEMSNIIMSIIYIIFLIVASFLIINTIIMVIHERIKEIGMMGALGMTRREIVSVFFLESLVLSFIGSVIGCAIGAIVTFVLSQFPFDIGSMMEDMIAMNNTIYVLFSPRIILQGFVYGLLVSGICTIFPSLKSAFIKPVEAIRR
jgi:putative ABC transport system permease protein